MHDKITKKKHDKLENMLDKEQKDNLQQKKLHLYNQNILSFQYFALK